MEQGEAVGPDACRDQTGGRHIVERAHRRGEEEDGDREDQGDDHELRDGCRIALQQDARSADGVGE